MSALPAPAATAELAATRERLARELAQLHWDLGGLVYEMAIRDHFRLDVVVRRAAEMQRVDADLGEVERLLALGDHGAAGTCPGCGSLRSRGAVFCWQCGIQLLSKADGSVGLRAQNLPGGGAA